MQLRKLVVTTLALTTAVAFAHGDWPAKHGGLLSEGGEITFELIRQRDVVTLFVEDHGEPVETAGAAGTIEVYSDAGTRTTEVAGGGGNKLTATGVQFAPGDRIRVRAMLPNRRVLIGRFSIK